MLGDLDTTQVTVAFLGGTAIVSASLISGVLAYAAARKGGSAGAAAGVAAMQETLAAHGDMLRSLVGRADERDQQHEVLEHRVDAIEQTPAVAQHLAAARGWHPPRPRPATDAG